MSVDVVTTRASDAHADSTQKYARALAVASTRFARSSAGLHLPKISLVSSSAQRATALSSRSDLSHSFADYEEDPIEAPSAAAPATNGEAATESKDQKGSYVGVHSTGFRDFLLKPELLRAISDLGFEHPSEGEHAARL